MLLPATEKLPEGQVIDARSPRDAAAFMLDGQMSAVAAVRNSVPDIITGSRAMAAALRAGGSVVYAAAGSSGLMALADACELPGTFGVPAGAIRIHMAGGVPVDGNMPGDTEDDTEAASKVVDDVRSGDVVIVLSASGTTPFALKVASSASEKGATIIGLANNPATPLLEMADIPVCVETPPEVIAGSTRLGAATAQKTALNLMSSLMGVDLGHVYQGKMVNVVADNAKLQKRAAGIVSDVAGVSQAAAEIALKRADGNTKAAVLVARGSTPEAAKTMLIRNSGHLGPCLHSLKSNQDVSV